jgi:hypothetical protein
MTDRNKSGLAFWATVVVVVVLVVYPLSFGPALWMAARFLPANMRVLSVYCPLVWVYEELPSSAQLPIRRHVIYPPLVKYERNLVMSGRRIFFVD